jgi:hypothetical protein
LRQCHRFGLFFRFLLGGFIDLRLCSSDLTVQGILLIKLFDFICTFLFLFLPFIYKEN